MSSSPRIDFQSSPSSSSSVALSTAVFLGRFGEAPVVITRLNSFFAAWSSRAGPWVNSAETGFPELDLLMNVAPHPNIVDFVGYSVRRCPTSGELEHYLVTRCFANTVTLEWALNNLIISSSNLYKISSQVAKALAHIHAAGFCVNDIGACNILIDADCNVKLFDFKLASRTCTILSAYGPIKVMAPEACTSLVSTVEGDAYQLGCLFITLVSRGRLPFHELSNQALLEKRLAGVTVSPSVPRSCSPVLAELAIRLTAANPKDRIKVCLASLSLSTFIKRRLQANDALPLHKEAAVCH